MADIITRFITKNPYFKDGKWLFGEDLFGFVLHSVGVGQPDPLVFINSWDNSNYTAAGINGFIGAEKVYITASCLDYQGTVKRMPSVGNRYGNDHYIGFEMTEPADIKYIGVGDKFQVLNLVQAQRFCRKTYANAVDLFARLCIFHGKDPLKAGVILSHNEAGKKGIGTAHTDPEHLWNGLKLPYTMDSFRLDVYRKMNHEGDEIDMTKQELENLIDERVRTILEGRDTKPSGWADKELAEAVAMKITDGSRPKGFASREECAAMVLRALKKAMAK